jgi:hypothetical protein
MKMLLGDFCATEEDIFKPIIGNERLFDISADNGVITVTPGFIVQENISRVRV